MPEGNIIPQGNGIGDVLELHGDFDEGRILDRSSLSLASIRPAWKASFTWDQVQKEGQLRQLLLRGPRSATEPSLGLSLRGHFATDADDGVSGTGQLVIDPVDLVWLETLLEGEELRDQAQWSGSSAFVGRLSFGPERLDLVDAHLLLFEGNIDLLEGSIGLQGARGSIRFPAQRLLGEPAETPMP